MFCRSSATVIFKATDSLRSSIYKFLSCKRFFYLSILVSKALLVKVFSSNCYASWEDLSSVSKIWLLKSLTWSSRFLLASSSFAHLSLLSATLLIYSFISFLSWLTYLLSFASLIFNCSICLLYESISSLCKFDSTRSFYVHDSTASSL